MTDVRTSGPRRRDELLDGGLSGDPTVAVAAIPQFDFDTRSTGTADK